MSPPFPSPSIEAAARFLEAIHQEPGDRALLAVWRAADRMTTWFASSALAAAFAAGQTDVYVGCALGAENLGSARRTRRNDTAAIGALWADVDVAGPTRKEGKRYAPSRRAALDMLHDLGELRPSLIVDSGYGLQAWWLLREQWTFADEAERGRAEELSRRLQHFVGTHADLRGWAIDPTADLTRILRIPGTFNGKGSEPVPVTVMEEECAWGRAFDPENLDSMLPASSRGAETFVGGRALPSIVLRPDAEVPAHLWAALREAEPRMLATFEHRRTDLKDQSASGYDMALANFAAQAQWSDQHICDLLVWHRRIQNADRKRPDYYARTIARARQGIEVERAEDVITDIAALGESAAIPADGAGRRAELLAKLTTYLFGNGAGPRLERIICYLKAEPVFAFVINGKEIEIGNQKNMRSPSHVEGVLTGTPEHYMLRADDVEAFKTIREHWRSVMASMFAACENIEVGESAHDVPAVIQFVREYVAEARPVDVDSENADTIAMAVANDAPLRREGHVYVSLRALRKRLATVEFERLPAGKLVYWLKVAGAAEHRLHVGEITRRFWRITNLLENE